MNPELHYLRGNILAATGQLAEAAVEYNATLNCAPDPRIRQYTLTALQNINARIPNGPGFIQPQIFAPAGHMEAQAQQHAGLMQQDAVSRAQILQNDSANFKTANQYQTQLTTRTMSRNHSDDGAAYAARQANREDRVQAQAENSAQAAMNLAQDKANAITESGRNLDYLMNTVPRGGTPALSPVGTNLYVRNYLDNPSNQNAPVGQSGTYQAGQFPTPLRAVPKSLTMNDSAKPGAHSKTTGKATATATVTGNVVKK